MTGLLQHDRTIPFPALTTAIASEVAVESLWLRPFGLFEPDWAIDFRRTPRPYLETQILQCCTYANQGQPLPLDFFWQLPVSKRTEGLMAIASLGDPGDQLTIDLTCHQPSCGEVMELELSRSELAEIQASSPDPAITAEWGDRRFDLRRPTGADQRHWLGQSFANPQAAIERMVTTLLPESQREAFHHVCQTQGAENAPGWLSRLNEAMEQLDPLINFGFQLVCPNCSTADFYPVDLGALALQKLWQAQDRLFETIHRLAAYYHWNEAEILAIPPQRRQRYLDRIAQEDGR